MTRDGALPLGPSSPGSTAPQATPPPQGRTYNTWYSRSSTIDELKLHLKVRELLNFHREGYLPEECPVHVGGDGID